MTKYCGLSKANDLAQRKVKLTRTISNGRGEMPKGSMGIVDCNKIRNGHIFFKADKCSCCNFQWRVGGLRYEDIELLPEEIHNPKSAKEEWTSDKAVLTRLKTKMKIVKNTFDDFTEDEYGDWIDSLEFDEFLELMNLCK